jgi:hypothetical protein
MNRPGRWLWKFVTGPGRRTGVYHFCTYFDRNYLPMGLTLYRSLLEHAAPFTLWVLCFDDECHDVLSRLELGNLRPIRLSEFEEGDPALLRAKSGRSRVEYYFTCTPSWPLYLLKLHPDLQMITYLDADLMFYSSPQPIYEELGAKSVLIIGHRFPEHLRYNEIYGIYNVGLLTFRNNSTGRGCLQWWRDRCLEWCFDRTEEGKFADQKYLDDWPERFSGVAVLQQKGAGLGPWNWMNYRIEVGDGRTMVDGQPLIFYHFQGLKILGRRFFDPGIPAYGRMPARLRRTLYVPYVASVLETERWVRDRIPTLEAVPWKLQSRHYRWWMFLLRLFQGQMMRLR